jgi:hypothetical protein
MANDILIHAEDGNISITGYSTAQFDGHEMKISSSAGSVHINGQQGITLSGTAIQWDDLRISADQVRTQGSLHLPTWDEWKPRLWCLQFTNNDQVFFTCQLPHGYVPGTDLYPHVHIIPNTTSATGTVAFGMEYSWLNVNGTYSESRSASGTRVITGEANKHIVIPLSVIPGSAAETEDGAERKPSSMLVCWLYRMDGGVETPSSYGQKVNFLEFDFHFRTSKLGTYNQWSDSDPDDDPTDE